MFQGTFLRNCTRASSRGTWSRAQRSSHKSDMLLWGLLGVLQNLSNEKDYQRKLWSNLPSYGWLLLNAEWCESLHHIRIRLVRPYSMKDGVRVCITWLHECCMHGACVRGKAGARNLVFFPVKWLQPAIKGTSCVRRTRLRSIQRRIDSFECLFMCNYVVFCACWLSGCRLQCSGCVKVAWCHGCMRNTSVFTFADGHRKSYWRGCIKAAIVIWQQILPILALVIFL